MPTHHYPAYPDRPGNPDLPVSSPEAVPPPAEDVPATTAAQAAAVICGHATTGEDQWLLCVLPEGHTGPHLFCSCDDSICTLADQDVATLVSQR